MKILVDKMPKTKKECIFATRCKYSEGVFCNLSAGFDEYVLRGAGSKKYYGCELEGDSCPYLKTGERKYE